MKTELGKHQKAALKGIDRGFKTASRGKVIMATGTGKTLVGMKAAQKYAKSSCLILVPSLSLAKQVYQEWRKWGMKGSWLAVCSDATVTEFHKKAKEAKKNEDDISIEELAAEVGRVVNTPEDIEAFLQTPGNRPKIVLATYQSAPLVADGMGRGFKFDLGVFDEAHKTTGQDGKLFSFALDDDRLAIHRRLFFTATPRVSAYKPKPGEKSALIHMDDEKVYGPTFYELSFVEAVKRGLVVDYEVVVGFFTEPGIGRKALAEPKAEMVAKTLAVVKAAKDFKLKKIFSFHADNIVSEIAKQLYERQAKGFDVFRVSGEQNAADRESILKAFEKAEKAIVTNARCLGEGVNVPACGAVAFLAPRRSKVDVVQAVGRACRLSPGKKKAFVILPVFVEQGESVEKALRSEAMDDAYATLNALRENDEVLADEIRLSKEAVRGKILVPLRPDSRKIRIWVDDSLKSSIGGLSLKRFEKSFRAETARALRFSRGYWSKGRCAKEALKYQTPSAFYRGSYSAYGAAKDEGWLADVCAHMTHAVREADKRARQIEDLLKAGQRIPTQRHSLGEFWNRAGEGKRKAWRQALVDKYPHLTSTHLDEAAAKAKKIETLLSAGVGRTDWPAELRRFWTTARIGSRAEWGQRLVKRFPGLLESQYDKANEKARQIEIMLASGGSIPESLCAFWQACKKIESRKSWRKALEKKYNLK